MNLLSQFRRLLFAQVLLGIAAFCIAEGNVGMFVAALAVAGLSWVVTEGPSGRPLPRGVTNMAAVIVLMVLLWRLLAWAYGIRATADLVVVMGHFTMWLQIVLLYRDKGTREEGQLLVLSVVQMIAASVVSISMVYGLLLAVYCVLAVATALLFQLKATSDAVHRANIAAAPGDRHVSPPKAVVSRGHRWHLRTSGATIGLTCAAVAVIVFVATPRRESPDPRTGSGGSAARQEAGFTESVNLSGGGPGDGGGQQAVMNVRIIEDGQRVESDHGAIYLRGASLDSYDPRSHRWTRGGAASHRDRTTRLDGADPDTSTEVTLADLPDDAPMRDVEVRLHGRGRSRVLFTLYPGLASLDSDHVNQLFFNALDHRLTASTRGGTVHYRMRVPRDHAVPDDARNMGPRYEEELYGPDSRWHRASAEVPTVDELRRYARGWRVEGERLRSYARDILERDAAIEGSPSRAPAADPIAVAQALAAHLKTFDYDLENPAPPPGEDAIVNFVFNVRRGHCELFAAAHVALCRAMGIPARVVTGYLATDYNRLGGYYTVRQRNAHAWSEIYAGPERGWVMLDATPDEPVRIIHEPPSGLLASVRHVYNYLEFTWVGAIVNYDPGTRERLLEQVQGSVSAAAGEDRPFGRIIAHIRRLPELWRLEGINYALAGFILVALALALATLAHTLLRRRQRFAALQLTALPRHKRRDLARRLGFYIHMLEMLERHGYRRPRWQSPQAFAHELAEANPLRFDPVVALTEVFYEIRFGYRSLNADRKQRIRAHLRHLEHALSEARM